MRGLVKQFDQQLVLRGINLDVANGQFLTLVGENGAGKSTLLRIVATLMRPTSGEVLLGGWPLPREAQRVRRYIGLVSHQSMLYRDLTAADNLRYFGRIYNLPDLDKKIDASLKRVGLFARQRDPVRTFSRGMVQRLTLARATLHEPDILLFDEPYTGLDARAADLLDGLLAQEQANGRTILLITHDLLRAHRLSERVAILHRGTIAHEIASGELSSADFLNLYSETVAR